MTNPILEKNETEILSTSFSSKVQTGGDDFLLLDLTPEPFEPDLDVFINRWNGTRFLELGNLVNKIRELQEEYLAQPFAFAETVISKAGTLTAVAA